VVGYFDDLAAALARSDLTVDDLVELADVHGIHIVGPPSERDV